MIIYIQATEPKISREEILDQLSEAIKAKVVGKGQLRAYTLAHEGITHPKIVGGGVERINWPRKIIEKVKDLVTTGTKFFVGHNSDNSTSKRPDVGEVIASFVKEINGVLSNIVVGHFPNKEDVSDLDVVSMEAKIDTDMYNNVEDIIGLSGIAMGSSHTESPAFPGAKLMAAIQCFEEPDKNKPNLEKEKPMTFAEVQTFVKEHNVHPSQLYNIKQIQSDREFVQVFDENAKLKSSNELLTKDNEKLKTVSEDSLKKDSQREAKVTLDKLIKEGYTDKQKAFIVKRFDPGTLDEVSENGVKKFLINTEKEYSDFAKLFGDTEEIIIGEGGETTKLKKKEDDSTTDPVEKAMAELDK